MAIAQVQTSNTFNDFRIISNQVISRVNEFESGVAVATANTVTANTLTAKVVMVSNVYSSSSNNVTINTNSGANSGYITIFQGLNANVEIAANGTGDIFLNSDTVRIGDQNADATLTTWGTGDLILSTNTGTNSGTIRIFDGVNANVVITPNGTGDVQLDADTVRIGDAGAAATLTTNGAGNLTLSTNEGLNSGTIVINQGVNANIVLAPNGTGDVQLDADTVRVGDAAAAATITTNGAGNLTLSTNGGTNSGTILINQGSNANVVITPNGTGDVQLDADTVRIGDSGASATLTTNGAGNLTLSTNEGANSGTIVINQGADANIEITPNGTGDIYLNADTLRVGDSGIDAIITTNGMGDLLLHTNFGTSSGVIRIYDGASANIAISPNGTGQVQLDSDVIRAGDQNSNTTITTWGTGDLILNTNSGANSGVVRIYDAANGNIELTPNGTGDVVISKVDINGGTIDGTSIGATTRSTGAFTTLTTNGNTTFTVNTPSSSTTTGSLVVTGGVGISENLNVGGYIQIDNLRVQDNTLSSTNTNGNIELTPNGSGDVYLNADAIRIGDAGTSATTLTTNGAGNLTISTNDGTNTGSILFIHGANNNIEITPHGTGSVVISKTDINGGTIDGTSIGASTPSSGAFTTLSVSGAIALSGGTSSSNTITGTLVVTGGVGVSENLNVGGYIAVDNLKLETNTLSSTDANGNIVLAPNGTGDVQLDADTVRIGDAGAAATLTTNGTGNLTLSTNSGTNSGTIVINQGTNANIEVAPNGTGDVLLTADTVRVGDSNADATVTTNGTGDLILSTNSGTNSGTVRIYDGASGNIELAPNANGSVVVTNAGTSNALRITQTGTGNALLVEDSANPDSTPFVINSSGQVIVGHTSSVSYEALGLNYNIPKVQILGDDGNPSSLFIAQYNTGSSVNVPTITLGKSKNATVGSHTAVAQNDSLAAIAFDGSDGTRFAESARILAATDGTVSANVVPGRLIFATSSANTPIEAIRIDSKQQIGIGNTPSSGRTLTVAKNVTGSTSNESFGILNAGQIQSDVTGTAIGIRSVTTTAAANFTLSQAINFHAYQGVIGANSSITNQYGFLVDSSFNGANNNYGFFSNIAANTGNWNFYAQGTARNFFNGNTGVGGDAGPTIRLYVGGNSTGSTSQIGFRSNETIQPDVTVSYQGVDSLLSTAANATPYTITSYNAYRAGLGAIGANSAVTTIVGFNALSNLASGTANYAFRGQFAHAANTFNIFMDGTASNYLAGVTTFANTSTSTSTTTGSVIVSGGVGVAENLWVGGYAQVDNLRLDTNTLSSTNTNGNIVLAPNGTGDVQLDADTVRVGDADAAATITTNGAGNLTLSTNAGTNSGIILFNQGANNNIEITPHGIGSVVIKNIRTANTITSTLATGTAPLVVASTTVVANLNADFVDGKSFGTFSAAGGILYASDTSTGAGTAAGTAGQAVISGGANAPTFQNVASTSVNSAIVTRDANGSFSANVVTATLFSGSGASLTNIPNSATTASSANGALTIVSRDGNGDFASRTGTFNTSVVTPLHTTSGTTNLTLSTNGGTNSGTIVINQGVNANIVLTPNGTGDVQLDADTVRIGDSAAAATLTTNGAGNLTLSTNSGTNSGTIVINQGVNANIEVAPNGTGDVLLTADTVRVGDSNADATITTNGTGDLILNTNAGSNSGVVRIYDATNGNIELAPNGTGVVYATTKVLVGTLTNTNSSRLVANGSISETVSSTQWLVASQYDVGTNPNQIPLNQYLGSLAFQSHISGGTF